MTMVLGIQGKPTWYLLSSRVKPLLIKSKLEVSNPEITSQSNSLLKETGLDI